MNDISEKEQLPIVFLASQVFKYEYGRTYGRTRANLNALFLQSGGHKIPYSQVRFNECFWYCGTVKYW